MMLKVQTNFHEEVVVYYQEWCTYRPIRLFEGDGDDDDDDGDYDYAPAA